MLVYNYIVFNQNRYIDLIFFFQNSCINHHQSYSAIYHHLWCQFLSLALLVGDYLQKTNELYEKDSFDHAHSNS